MLTSFVKNCQMGSISDRSHMRIIFPVWPMVNTKAGPIFTEPIGTPEKLVVEGIQRSI